MMQGEDNDPSQSDGGGGVGGAEPTTTTSVTGRGARHRSAAAAAAVAAAAAASASAYSSATSATSSQAGASHVGAAPAGAAAGAPLGSSTGSGSSGLLSKLILLVTLILKILLYPLRKLSTILFPPGPYDGLSSSASSDKAARAFVSTFRNQYLSNGTPTEEPPPNPFSTSGYRSTLARVASRSPSSPLMLIYVHSPLHPDCVQFCSTTLSDGRIVRYLNDSSETSIISFGATVHSADGCHLANVLGAASFPFLCLVHVKSSGGTGGGSGGGRNSSSSSSSSSPNITLEIKLRMQGRKLVALHPDTLLAYLQTVVRQHSVVLQEAAARRMQREEEAMLRQEQDREYREALEADRAREEARRMEREREEEERRVREEEERRKEEERQSALAVAMSLVEDEPPPGGRPGTTARVRLTLPNGKRIDRRFRAEDTIEVVRAYLTVYFHENEVGITNFELSSSYPKRMYDDIKMTLKEGGLVPQAVLMVQDLDA